MQIEKSMQIKKVELSLTNLIASSGLLSQALVAVVKQWRRPRMNILENYIHLKYENKF